jgi:uncharacterized protein (DUF427 family)
MSQAAAQKRSAFAENPDYRVDFLPCQKRVRVMLGGETLADTTRVRLMRESRHVPVYYFPREDLRMDLLARSDHRSFCPFKGDAAYWHAEAGGRRAENAVWSYEGPFPGAAAIKDYLAFYWNKMDHWYEEDEEVFVHARDPHVRIDVLESRRPLEVVLGGETVAKTSRARFLFETGLPTRYYIPREDLRMDLLTPSESRTACPYKGAASYYTAQIGGETYEDIAWFYPEPIDEIRKIKGLVCFFNEKVEAIRLDGAALAKPETKHLCPVKA